MNYKFPPIYHIDDVLPYVIDHPDFVVAERDGFTVINYNSMSSDTFRPLLGDDSDHGNLIRRECRGIIFDKTTGDIVRRPLHKFFNINEREETLEDQVDLDLDHVILEKLDGSMIVPFITTDRPELRVGTKMGETDIANQARDFIAASKELTAFCHNSIEFGISPIFEWMSNDNRVVIDYQRSRLVLIAMRDIVNGSYVSFKLMTTLANKWGVEVVGQHKIDVGGVEHLVSETRTEVGVEGYVVRFNSGHMVKIKTDWYCAIHKAKENLLYERYIIKLIIDQTIDDVKSFLMQGDRDRIDRYVSEFETACKQIDIWADRAFNVVNTPDMSKKIFALIHAESFGSFASIVFKHFDQIRQGDRDQWFVTARAAFMAKLVDACNSNSRLAEFKKAAKLEMVW